MSSRLICIANFVIKSTDVSGITPEGFWTSRAYEIHDNPESLVDFVSLLTEDVKDVLETVGSDRVTPERRDLTIKDFEEHQEETVIKITPFYELAKESSRNETPRTTAMVSDALIVQLGFFHLPNA